MVGGKQEYRELYPKQGVLFYLQWQMDIYESSDSFLMTFQGVKKWSQRKWAACHNVETNINFSYIWSFSKDEVLYIVVNEGKGLEWVHLARTWKTASLSCSGCCLHKKSNE